MAHRYHILLLFAATLKSLTSAAQYTSYERVIPVGAFSIEPHIRSGQLMQGQGSALLAFNAEIGTLGDADMLLRTVDASGTTLHNLTLGDMSGMGYHDVGMEVVQVADAYYLCGYTRSIDTENPPTFTAFLIKTDTALNLQWQRNYLLPAPYELYANAMTATNDGGLLIAGQVYDASGFHTLLMKVSAADGSLVWANRYDLEFSERVYAVRELPGGDIMLSGNVVFSFELVLPLAMKTGPHGEFIWGKYFNYPPMSIVEQSNFLSLHVRDVDDILLCGHTDVMGQGGEDIYVVNIDSSGAVNWVRTYGTPAFDMPSAFQWDEAGQELVALGFSSWFTAAQSPTALSLRIAPDGLLIDSRLHGDTTGAVQNGLLTTSQRLSPSSRLLAGWHGFPAELYVTGVDNDLGNTCNAHAVPISPGNWTTTTGGFSAIITPLSLQLNDLTFNASSLSDEVILCDSPLAAPSLSAAPIFSVQPNPAMDDFVIVLPPESRAIDVVEILDTHGRTVRTMRANNGTRLIIARSGLRAGAYAVRFLRDGLVLGSARLILE
ncbi:MAG: T9SS type A sorting domain-containing protein [Flavobacteriales bacterium]|nr:T9SS type A sorting domain-containing protein [Flavobacteriales bacterium]